MFGTLGCILLGCAIICWGVSIVVGAIKGK